mmetsp:Transcript_30799/g.99286  ORF Transcript_30799/g.99286 Transcript_30799/m.99286 type:complete len:369 (+) Transcript_30799:1722-2828(+)
MRVHGLDEAGVEVGEVAGLAEGSDSDEDGGEEAEAVEEGEDDGDEDEGAELLEEDDPREEHGHARADGRDGAGQYGGPRVDEGVDYFIFPCDGARGHVGVGEVDGVVDGEADDDDDEDGLDRAEAPAEDLDAAEDDGADHANSNRRDGRRDPVPRREHEDDPGEEERKHHVRDAARYQTRVDGPLVRVRHVGHDLQRIRRVRVGVVHPVVPLLREVEPFLKVALRRRKHGHHLDVVQRYSDVPPVRVRQGEDVVHPPVLVHGGFGSLQKVADLVREAVVLLGALEEGRLRRVSRFEKAHLRRDGEVAVAVTPGVQVRRRVQPQRRRRGLGVGVDELSLGVLRRRDREGVEARLTRRLEVLLDHVAAVG